MSDKYRSLTQSSAFKRQRKPSDRSPHPFRPIPSHHGSLPTRAGSTSTCGKLVLVRANWVL